MVFSNIYSKGEMISSTPYRTKEDAIEHNEKFAERLIEFGMGCKRLNETTWESKGKTICIEDNGSLVLHIKELWQAISANYDEKLYLTAGKAVVYICNKVLPTPPNPFEIEKKVTDFAELYYTNALERAKINWYIQTTYHKK